MNVFYCRQHASIVFGTVSTFLLLYIILGFFFSDFSKDVQLPEPPEHSPQERPSWRRDPDEYVLSPSWDAQAAPQRRYYNWTVTEISANPDGVWRTLIVINQQFPGPLIEVNEGDTLVVDVHNAGENSTSIHWHGQFQNGSNWMDGTAGITNCPIAPGHSFRYEFTIQNPAGTYWYHAHFSTQRVDGLFGPLIIHSAAEFETMRADYDTDNVVLVQDYYHDLSAALLPTYLAPNNENAEPIPDGALLNGQNIFSCAHASPTQRCDATAASLATFALDPSRAHRLRFINVGAFAEFDIDIDEHSMTLLEVDSTRVAPQTFNRLRINVAQRYSVLLTPQSKAPYYLRARMLPHCFAEIPPTLATEVRAILHAPSTTTTTTTTTSTSHPSQPSTTGWSTHDASKKCIDMNLTAVAPLDAHRAPPATHLLHLRTNFEIGAFKLSRGFINTTSWRPSRTTPTLLSAIEGLSTGNKSFSPEGDSDSKDGTGVLSSAYDLNRQLVYSLGPDTDQVVDILVSNFDDGNHPLHLHGHDYFVLGAGVGYYPADDDSSSSSSSLASSLSYPPRDEVLENPLRRDTATVPAFGWLLVRVVARNAGLWALHCHLAWHSEAGMMAQVLVGTGVVAGWEVPEGVREGCAVGGEQRWMGVEDREFEW